VRKQLNDREAICVVDSGGPREPRVRWGPDSLMGRGNLVEEGVARPIGTTNCKVCGQKWVDDFDNLYLV